MFIDQKCNKFALFQENEVFEFKTTVEAETVRKFEINIWGMKCSICENSDVG